VIGNDVVDLADPEASEAALHPRFDARAFAPAERALLARAADPTRLRWALWAAKEAAYKAARQLDPGARFHPREFVVEGGAVRNGALRFLCRVREAGGALHAVAVPAPGEPGAARAGVARVRCEDDAGSAARRLALRAGARLLGVAAAELAIVREGRRPQLLLRGRPAGLALSLSHHGRFAAFALAPAAGERA
jgi:4'-phosphopantetheinyl transferase superfamily protein